MDNVGKDKIDKTLIKQTRTLPPKARSNQVLNIKEKISFKKKVELHPLFLASKKHKLHEDADNLFFFKLNPKKTAISQLEAYCGAISRLIAPNYVPSLSIYYDEENCFIGIASKAWPDYKANADDPLTFDDIEIGGTSLDMNCQINWLQRSVEKLLQFKLSNAANISNYFDFNFLASLWSQEPDITNSLKQFHQKGDSFSKEDVNTLLDDLTKWGNCLKNKTKLTSEEKHEWQLLYEILGTIERLFDMENNPPRGVSLQKILAFEENLSSQGDPLKESKIFTNVQLQHFRCLKGIAIALMTRYIFKEGDHHNCNFDKNGRLVDFNMTKLNILFDYKEHNLFDYILRKPLANTFVCTAYDIDHFPDIKDANFYFWPTKQTEVVPIVIDIFTKFLDQSANFTQENDDDLQLKILNIVTDVLVMLNISDNILLDRLSRSLFTIVVKVKAFFLNVSAEELADVERRKYVFSVLRDNFTTFVKRYEDGFAALEKHAHEYFGPKHYYNEQDNKVFQKLAGHPVFTYYKYRTLLKYLLTDAPIYQDLAALYFSPDQLDPRSTNADNFITKLVIDERLRLEEIKDVVVNMPAFKDFLSNYGNIALQGILREFREYKEKYAAKLTDKPYYEKLVNQLDNDTFIARYENLCHLSGVSLVPAPDPEMPNMSL